MNARAKQLAEIGYKAWDEALEKEQSRGRALVSALAAMLATPPAKKEKPAGPALPFTPQQVHQALQVRVGHLITCDLVNSSYFGHLGRKLKELAGAKERPLEAADLERLVSWIEAGGLSYLDGKVQPTFQMVVNQFDKYVSWARQWDADGRGIVNRKSGSKRASYDSGNVGDLFKK